MPSGKSILNWTSSINGEPGFFKEVFDALQTMSPDDRHCNLIFDAMSIKKQISWDERLGKFVGYCDYGNAFELEGSETPATEALVFMLTSINGKWKLPIGYVFQNKITASIQAELIKSALTHAHNAGLTIWSVTCDGAYTNVSTLKLLGCKIGNNYDDIESWLEHPVTRSKVYYIPDACHMLKLARNILANNYVLESDTGYIRWDHIRNLFKVQKELTLKLANKLSMAHVNWHNNKMRVQYAAQTLSSSTADSLEYLKNINFPGFENVEATVEYCRAIDRIFDFLNSKSKFSKAFKSPIYYNTIEKLEEIIIPLIKYLYTLKFKGSPLHISSKKTFILGFAIAVKSFFSMSRSLFVQHPNFKYLLTYKFSQDHLELLFGRIRQRLGSNNNPNTAQFKTAIKQILMKNAIKCRSKHNCNTFDDDPIGSLFDFKWRTKKDNIDYEKVNFETIDIEALKKLQLLNSYIPESNDYSSTLQDAKNNILYYIVGYLIRKLNLDCSSCENAVLDKFNEHDYCKSLSFTKFVNFKNRGGLVFGSKSVFLIILEAEKMFLFLTDNFKSLQITNLEIKIIKHVIVTFSTDKNIFPNLNCENISILERPHKILLITLLTKKFLKLRLKSFSKMYSSDIMNPVSKRHKLSKLILFSNQ